MTLPYPPPWQDLQTLCEHISVSENTVENWVKKGVLPPPRKRGGTLMFKWKEVEAYLENGGPDVPLSPDAQAEEIRDATRKACQADH